MKLSLLSVSIMLCCAPAVAGDLRVSPSLHIHTHKADVTSPHSDLLRNDFVYGVEGAINASYKTSMYELTADVWNEMFQYSNFSEANSNNINYLLNFDTSYPDNEVEVYAKHGRRHEVMNSIRGGFKDKMFAYDTNTLIEHNLVGFRYDGPAYAVVDSFFNWFYQGDRTINAGLIDSYFYDQNTYHAILGNYKDNPRLYLKFDSQWDFYRRIDRRQYNIRQTQAEVRWALNENKNYFVVANAADSVYENPTISDESVLGYAKQRTWSTGLAWQSDSRRTFAQLTQGREKDRDDRFVSGNFSYVESTGHQLNFSYNRRFYGDNPSFSWVYENDRFRSEVRYGKKVELNYMISAQQYLSALYACPSQLSELDPEECRVLSSAQDNISDNEKLFPKFEMRYPLDERLLIEDRRSISLSRRHGSLDYRFFILGIKTQDLEYSIFQNSIESHFSLIKNEGQPNEYHGEIRFRKTELQPADVFSFDRLYNVTYQRNLNTHAYFQLYAQVIDKDSTDNRYSFTDRRIGLHYVHLFGDRHPDALNLSKSYEENRKPHELSRSRFSY